MLEKMLNLLGDYVGTDSSSYTLRLGDFMNFTCVIAQEKETVIKERKMSSQSAVCHLCC